MSVAVVVPRQGSDPARAAAWEWVRDRYATTHPGWAIVEGTLPAGQPWCKAAAVAAVLPRVNAEVLVIADADSWSAGTARAVHVVEAGHHGWAVPHWHVRRLSGPATTKVLDGAVVGGELERSPYVGYAGGGITVVRRDVYDRTPLDGRFLGWGGEDMSWGAALATLEGPGWRGQADLWHLHHGAPPRTQVYDSAAARDLHHRYRQARGRPERMRELVEEGRCTTAPA